MSQKRIGIFSRIFRNEETVRRAIECILNQTYKNFKFYILVNEKTYDLINEYAVEDNRINIINVDPKNTDVGFVTYMYDIAAENDFVCTIDGDDWYEHDFFESMINFAERDNLDLVGCGSVFESSDGKLLGHRSIYENIIWNNKDFHFIFPQVFMFFRTLWGKLYSSSLFIEGLDRKLPPTDTRGGYAGDTILSLLISNNAERLGILNGTKHHYTVSYDSGSYRILKGRFNADFILHQFLYNFLNRFEDISEENLNFIFKVFGNGLNDTLNLVFRNYSDFNQISKILVELFNNEFSRTYFEKYDSLKIRENIFDAVFIKNNCLISRYNKEFYSIFTSLYFEFKEKITSKEFYLITLDINNLELLVKKEYNQLFYNLINTGDRYLVYKKEFNSIISKITNNNIINYIIERYNCIDFIIENKKLILDINAENYQNAKTYVILKLEKSDINDSNLEIIVDIYINLSALTSDIDGFIQGKIIKANLYRCQNKDKDFEYIIEELKELGVEPVF